MKKIILALLLTLLTVFLIGCNSDDPESSMKTSEPIPKGGVDIENTATDQGDLQVSPLVGDVDLKSLEITPSGDAQCFLSPCDCQCYKIENVPLNKRKTTCGTDCADTYGTKGCQFTNFQCATLN